MKEPKIIAIGDNVCDKYLSRGKMYPGDNVSIHVYMQMEWCQFGISWKIR